MMSDESHIELHLGGRQTCCRQPVGSDRLDSKFTEKRVKHPQKVMVWRVPQLEGLSESGVPEKGGDNEQPDRGTCRCWMAGKSSS